MHISSKLGQRELTAARAITSICPAKWPVSLNSFDNASGKKIGIKDKFYRQCLNAWSLQARGSSCPPATAKVLTAIDNAITATPILTKTDMMKLQIRLRSCARSLILAIAREQVSPIQFDAFHSFKNKLITDAEYQDPGAEPAPDDRPGQNISKKLSALSCRDIFQPS